MIKNKKIFFLSFIFLAIFLYDFENGITDYLFLILSGFLFITAFIIPKNISDYIFIVVSVSYLFLLTYTIYWSPVLSQYSNYYMDDEILGYKLKPNVNTTFDDNIRKGVIKTNSLGYRDDEFISNGNNNIVLLGDSSTFGELVDQQNNLDKQIEQLCGDINAHNLGVGGYGFPGIINTYKKYNLEHTHAIYFFHMNDLRSDNFTVHEDTFTKDGYLIFNGTEKTEQEIENKLEEIKIGKKLNPFKLRYFFLTLKGYLARIGLMDLDNELEYFPYGGYSDDLRIKGVNLTSELKEIVNSKKADFTVVIVPSLRSINSQKNTENVQKYIDNIISNGIRVIDPLKDLDQRDFIYYDGHWTESGMKKVALKLCKLII
jgi:hypothetical protein